LPEAGDGPAPGVHFVRKTDVNQATVVLGHMGMKRRADDPDYAATIVANDILGGGGFAARLLQKVRTEMGLAYGVYSSFNAPYSHKGTFSLTCQTKSGSTLQAINAIRKELERIRAERVTDDELRVAKESIQQQLIFESETKAEVIQRALRYEYWGFPARR
jgi:zinc protease